MDKPSIGRIVHYGIGKDYDGKVVHRPAIIVRDWDGGDHPNIQVFLDGSNDHRYGFTEAECSKGLVWRTSVNPGEGINEWCWPVRK